MIVRYLLPVIVLFMAVPAWGGYSIVQIPKVTPEYVVVAGPHGPVSRRNPGSWQRPATGQQRVYQDITGLNGDDPTRRVELWRTTDGTATDAEIFTACPGLRDHVAALIRAEGNARLLAVASPYQPAERETWSIQVAEAAAWRADSSAATPMTDAIAAARGVAKATLVGWIEEMDVNYRAACGAILGTQQKLLEQVYTATTVDALLAVTWP